MYLERILKIYSTEISNIQKRSNANLLKNNHFYQRLIDEFASVVNFAMSRVEKDEIGNQIIEDIKAHNADESHINKVNISTEEKINSFLNPSAEKIANYKPFYINALIKNKDLVNKFDEAFPTSGLKLPFLKRYELKQEEQKIKNLSERDNMLLGNYDTDFLEHGTKIVDFDLGKDDNEAVYNFRTATRDKNNKQDRYNMITELMAQAYEAHISFDDDFTGRTKTAYNMIFNIKSGSNPNGDELTAENMEMGLTAISNLITNHNKRPLWQRFFGYFGKIGDELNEANNLKNRMIARYNLNPQLVETFINSDGFAKAQAIDALRAEKGFVMNYEVSAVNNPNNDREGYNIEEKGKEKKISFKDEIIFDKEDIIKGLDIEDEQVEEVFNLNANNHEMDFGTIDEDFDLIDEEQRKRDKLIVTFNNRKSTPEMYEEFAYDDIDINIYTRKERREYLKVIEEMDEPQYDYNDGEIELDMGFETKMNQLQNEGKISEINDGTMLHKLLERDSKEVVNNQSGPINQDDNIIIDQPKIDI